MSSLRVLLQDPTTGETTAVNDLASPPDVIVSRSYSQNQPNVINYLTEPLGDYLKRHGVSTLMARRKESR